MGWPSPKTILQGADRRFGEIIATIREENRRTLLANLGLAVLGLGIAASAVTLGATLLSPQPPVLTRSGRDCTSITEAAGALAGTDGADCLEGSGGNDEIYAEAGDDSVAGNQGNDELHGGAGNDTLWGGRGRDVFDCGEGHDVVHNKFATNGDVVSADCETVLTM